MLIVDFETRSRCDLKKAGAYNYALDPSTQIICAAFIDVDSDFELLWYAGDKLPKVLTQHIENADLLAAHNAQFDRLIWECVAVNDWAFPLIEFDRWYCTSAQCRVNGLPASLEDAARALNTRHQKDFRGSQLIRALSIPRADGSFNYDPALIKEMGDYCMQDARTTKALVETTRRLSTREHEDWLYSEDINERGVLIDLELAEAAQVYATAETIEIADALSAASGGVITKHTQTTRAAKWVADRLRATAPAALPMLHVWRADELKLTLDKNAREELLDADELGEIDLPDDVYNVVSLLHESSQSSVYKFKSMAERADPVTHRLNGAFIYAGASQTLRFSSRGMQIHNMPQRGGFKTLEEADRAYDKIMSGCALDGPVMPLLKNLLRYAIKAQKGKTLIVGDWSGIEARILPWLSASPGGLAKLNRIASGVDVYQETAIEIGLPDRRDIGKVMELACGYQGSVKAFKQFAKGYGIAPMPDTQIQELIWTWRDVNDWVVQFWYALEAAAIAAVQHPDKVYRVGKIGLVFYRELMGGSLLMILPDETILTYPKARVEAKEGRTQLTALKASVKMRADAKEWPREQLYGGKLAGHGTQGTAAGLLRDLLARLNDVIAHVHDEVIQEVPIDEADERQVELRREMKRAPVWAEGLPLEAKPIITERYRK